MTDISSPPGLAGPLPEPRAVAAGRGLDWIKEGFGYLRKDPGIWILVVIIYCVINVVIAFIPLINVAASVLGPVWVAGLMLGCRAQEQGESLTLAHLFAGFRNRLGQLALLGLGTGLVTGGLAFAIIGQSYAEMMALGMAGVDPATTAGTAAMTLTLRALVFLAVLVPIAMAVWFAPALIVIDGVSAMDAAKLSFRGCMKNIVPFLVYGVVTFVLLLLAIIPLALGLLLLMPTIIASMYRAYRDIFA